MQHLLKTAGQVFMHTYTLKKVHRCQRESQTLMGGRRLEGPMLRMGVDGRRQAWNPLNSLDESHFAIKANHYHRQ